jgi:hypothetical protein
MPCVVSTAVALLWVQSAHGITVTVVALLHAIGRFLDLSSNQLVGVIPEMLSWLEYLT